MGRRLPSQVFLPNKWVFPGGRVDDDDRALCGDRWLRCRARAAAREAAQSCHLHCAAVRETFEETGILIWADLQRRLTALCRPPGRRFADWRDTERSASLAACARNHPAWTSRAGSIPGSISPNAAATRQAVRARRMVNCWIWHGLRLPRSRALDLAIITRLIVDDVASALAAGGHPPTRDIPFYFQGVDGYRADADRAPRTVPLALTGRV